MNLPRLQLLSFLLAAGITLTAVLGYGGSPATVSGTLIAVASLGLALVLGLALLNGIPLSGSYLLIPMAGFAAEAWAQWQFQLSVYPGQTLTGLLQLIALGAVFWLAWFGLRRPMHQRLLARGVWLFTGLLGGEAIAQYFTAGKWIYWTRDATYADPMGPFVYHNHFAGCMEMLLPISVVYALRDRANDDIFRRVGRALPAVIGLISLVLAHSRGGLVVVLFELSAVLVLIWWAEPQRRFRLHVWAIVAAGAACTALVSWQPLLARLEMLQYHDPSALDRLAVDRICWHIFQTYPRVGVGLNGFPVVFPRFRTFDDGLTWNAAHNDWLQALAEMGWVGALAILGFIAVAVAEAGRALRGPKHAIRTMQLAAAIGAVGLLFHSFVDFQFHSFANASLFFLLIASATVPTPLSRHRRSVIPILGETGFVRRAVSVEHGSAARQGARSLLRPS